MDLYSDENIRKKYGNVSIRVINQNPLGNSFKIKSKELKFVDEWMTINEYLNYWDLMK